MTRDTGSPQLQTPPADKPSAKPACHCDEKPGDRNSGPLDRVDSFFRDLGPGLITGCADDDPSGISTYSVAGAASGYGTLWTALISYVATAFFAHVDWRSALAATIVPHLSWSRDSLSVFVAVLGTTISPFRRKIREP